MGFRSRRLLVAMGCSPMSAMSMEPTDKGKNVPVFCEATLLYTANDESLRTPPFVSDVTV